MANPLVWTLFLASCVAVLGKNIPGSPEDDGELYYSQETGKADRDDFPPPYVSEHEVSGDRITRELEQQASKQRAPSVQKAKATPVQKGQAPPVQKPQATPVQKSQAPPAQKPQATPVQKGQAPPVQKPQAPKAPKTEAAPVQKPQAPKTEAAPAQKPQAPKTEAAPAQKPQAPEAPETEAAPAPGGNDMANPQGEEEEPAPEVGWAESLWNNVVSFAKGVANTSQEVIHKLKGGAYAFGRAIRKGFKG